jgi:hypothetical protein
MDIGPKPDKARQKQQEEKSSGCEDRGSKKLPHGNQPPADRGNCEKPSTTLGSE